MVDDSSGTIDQHSLWQSLVLHLLPGILMGVFYFSFYLVFQSFGYPSIFVLMLSVIFILIPFEFGYLLLQCKKQNKKLKNIISYQNKIKTWEYFVLIPVLFVVLGIIFTIMRPLDSIIQNEIFGWIPKLNNGLMDGFVKTNLIITYSLVLVFGMFIGPIVEELYFRGYLLPRMKYAGRLGSLLHSLLFALYHVFTPWMLITRTIGILPLILIVKKKNIHVSIVVHILMNSIDVVTGVVFIMVMS
jgi:uncharacterized protein